MNAEQLYSNGYREAASVGGLINFGLGRPLASQADAKHMLILRPTGLSSPAYRDWLDYTRGERS
jgi:hypothetical protein